MTGARVRTLLVGLASAGPLAFAQAQQTDADPDAAAQPITWAIGAGGMRSPAWVGSSRSRYDFIPYFAFNWRDIVELNVTDGLYVDLLHGSAWHGGLMGSWRWGRPAHDLGPRLSEAGVAPLSYTLQAGTYLEYVPIESLTLGADLSRDIRTSGSAYGNFYVEWDIPVLKPIEHSLKFNGEFMNRTAMQRYFSVSANTAAALGVEAYHPGAGPSGTGLSYQAFLPTSRSTGFALELSWMRLAAKPTASPLVRDYGDRTNRTYSVAFLKHF
jgi:outer membrane scaffolding protein for murein synthesis (MipA/OmpV family)